MEVPNLWLGLRAVVEAFAAMSSSSGKTIHTWPQFYKRRNAFRSAWLIVLPAFAPWSPLWPLRRWKCELFAPDQSRSQAARHLAAFLLDFCIVALINHNGVII